MSDVAADHYVNPAPFQPAVTEKPTLEQEKFLTASAWKLVWWRFRAHRISFGAALFLLYVYLQLPFVEVIAPYPLAQRHGDHLYAPPQAVHLMHNGELRTPFVYPYKFVFDLKNFRRNYEIDTTQPQALRFFCRGQPYLFWGLVRADFHIVCPPDGGTFFPFGTDRLGRDMLSRIIYGARISLTVGLIGIAISFTIGLTLGGLAGYAGGWIDHGVLRLIEILKSLPELPLWLALSAALPADWSPLLVFFGITLILGLLDWPGLALAVRAKLLSLRTEDFVRAAELMGASRSRIIARHLIPNFLSHLVASASLTIPAMILGETALSFLGLGLRPPVTSWGVLLNEAQNLAAVNLYPWLMIPVAPVMMVVLAFNLVGDGLRDAADPHN